MTNDLPTKLTLADGHRYALGQVQVAPEWSTIIDSIDRERYYDRYDNPFEQKWTLKDKSLIPVLDILEGQRALAERLFGTRLYLDEDRHYAGLFKYEQGDRLSVHVDAGIHPLNGKRKHVTALLYLSNSGGPLEFWSGSAANGEKAKETRSPIFRVIQRVYPRAGTFVLFENNDFAWHGAEINDREESRIVATVSFLSDVLEGPWFNNKRTRAFFVPRPDERWTEEMFRLRDTRADPERFAEAYRANA